MRVEEAKYIKLALDKYTGHNMRIEVLLNLGSSTEYFRKFEQPHIDKEIFKYVRKNKYNILHFDLKNDTGIDISGNIFDKKIQEKLQDEKPSIIMCCNLLEHLESEQRNKIPSIIDDILRKNGILLITVPYSYPLHLDPIDTYFRPSPEKISKLFYRYEVLDESIVESTTFFDEFKLLGVLSKMKLFIRLFAPFYKYKQWQSLMHRTLWLFRSYKVSCVVLRKI